jgi:hypothetical protein
LIYLFPIVSINCLMPILNGWSDPLGSCKVKRVKPNLEAIELEGRICWINGNQNWESLVEANYLNFWVFPGLDKILVKAIQGLCWCENLFLNIEDCLAGNDWNLIDYLGLELWVALGHDISLLWVFFVLKRGLIEEALNIGDVVFDQALEIMSLFISEFFYSICD